MFGSMRAWLTEGGGARVSGNSSPRVIRENEPNGPDLGRDVRRQNEATAGCPLDCRAVRSDKTKPPRNLRPACKCLMVPGLPGGRPERERANRQNKATAVGGNGRLGRVFTSMNRNHGRVARATAWGCDRRRRQNEPNAGKHGKRKQSHRGCGEPSSLRERKRLRRPGLEL